MLNINIIESILTNIYIDESFSHKPLMTEDEYLRLIYLLDELKEQIK